MGLGRGSEFMEAGVFPEQGQSLLTSELALLKALAQNELMSACKIAYGHTWKMQVGSLAQN